MNRTLSQQEIDALFDDAAGGHPQESPARKVVPFDFRRPDRIAKSQLRAIHQLHETFVHNLVSSLSAYLRTYLLVNLVSVEQLSCEEFLNGLPSPTCMLSLGLRPYDGYGLLELSPALVFPILEVLLGGDGKSTSGLRREITEIEQKLLDSLFRIILNDLKAAWQAVAPIEFTIHTVETEPQFLRVLAPSEAVVAVGIEIRIGDNLGMMNIAVPSIIAKMMRQKFDQQWSIRRTQSTEAEQTAMLARIRPSLLDLDVRLRGPRLLARDLLRLAEGDVLTFDFPVSRPVDGLVNGKLRFGGRIVESGRKRGFVVETGPLSAVPAEKDGGS
ncbi:MAG TPA: flagellar motor switch protein FliM [Bryobacteraceae bacterium]|nr:flagellar motor switch protein FliM [Bryobacteraceae bacterium]